MATGKVQFIGTVISSGDFSGFPASNAFDNDFSTDWAASTANGGWIGLDLGVAATVTDFEIAPQATTAGAGNDQEARIFGGVVQSGTDSVFTTPTTYYTVATPPAAPFNAPNVRNRRTLSGASAARYWRFAGATGTFGGAMAELRFIGNAGTTATAKPVRPSISPYGGSAVSGSVTVTISSLTTSASIYYTTDGTVPTTGSSLYTGPFALTVGAGGATVRAIANDASLSAATSEECNPAVFRNYEFKPRDTWQDSNGETVESHCPSICEWPVGSGDYWMASNSANCGTNSNIGDTNGRYGVWLYKARLTSTGFTVWQNFGNVIGCPTEYEAIVRPSLLVSKTGALTLWVRGYAIGFTNLKARIWSCTSSDPSVPGNWTDHGDYLPDGKTEFQDFSRVMFNGDGYVLYSVDNSAIIISKMTDDFLGTTGTDFITIPGSSGESPIGVQWGSKLIIFFDAVTNGYDSTSTFETKCVTTTAPLTSGAYSSVTGAFAVDPVGTDFNAQPSSIFVVPNKVNGFVYVGDFWVQNNLEASRSVLLPIDVTGAAPVVSIPATWDFSNFTNSGGGGSGGGLRGRSLPSVIGGKRLRGRDLP